MDTESKDQPSGSLPRRYIDKLRAMRADIDEIIGYLARIDGTPPAPPDVSAIKYRKGRIGNHIPTILSIKGPATAEEIYEALKAGGRRFGDQLNIALGNVKKSLTQMEPDTVVRIDEWHGLPKDYPGRWELKK